MDERRTLLGRLHAARQRLGLEDSDYRAMLERITGKRSAANLSPSELRAVLDVIAPKQRTVATLPPHARKVQALWLAGWNLGLIRDRSDHAMRAFITRQTGIDHERWLIDARDAARVAEALKSWLAREGGVEWARWADPRRAVAEAQWRIVSALRANHGSDPDDLELYGSLVTGKSAMDLYRREDWIKLQQAMGRELRRGRSRKRPGKTGAVDARKQG